MRRLLLSLFALLVASPALAQVPFLSGSIDLVSRYEWRGQTLADRPAIQPTVEASLGNITFSAWGSMVTSNRDLYAASDELDLTIDYSLGIPKLFNVSTGLTLYTYPNQDGASFDQSVSPEVYVGASSDLFLSPEVTVYYDFNLGKGFYAEAAAGPEFDVSGLPLAIRAVTGYNFDQYGLGNKLSHVGGELSTEFGFGPVSITPHAGVVYSNIEEQARGIFGLSIGID